MREDLLHHRQSHRQRGHVRSSSLATSCAHLSPTNRVRSRGMVTRHEQVRGFAEGQLGRAKEYALATAEVRVPVSNFLGRLSAQVRVSTGR